MRCSGPSKRRASTTIALVCSVAVHGAMVLAWLLQRPELVVPEPPAIKVTLVAPPPPLAPEPDLELEPERQDRTINAAASSASAAAMRPRTTAPTQAPSPLVRDSTGTPTRSEGAPASPAAPTDLSAFGRALAARTGCNDPERLTDAERERCAERVMATPEQRMKETNAYIRIGEHVAIMGELRRRENTATRMSCEGHRNLEPSCPNFLPDNHPKDYEHPRD